MHEEWTVIISYYIGLYWVGTIHGAQGPFTLEWYVGITFMTGAAIWPRLIMQYLNVQGGKNAKSS